MRSEGWAWTLSASFLEIYNESLRDLLHSGKEAQPSYAIKHDEAWGTVVANMSRVDVASMDQINALMARAAKQRAVGSTDMNAQSSRCAAGARAPGGGGARACVAACNTHARMQHTHARTQHADAHAPN